MINHPDTICGHCGHRIGEQRSRIVYKVQGGRLVPLSRMHYDCSLEAMEASRKGTYPC